MGVHRARHTADPAPPLPLPRVFVGAVNCGAHAEMARYCRRKGVDAFPHTRLVAPGEFRGELFPRPPHEVSDEVLQCPSC
jgi:hypothetical protein